MLSDTAPKVNDFTFREEEEGGREGERKEGSLLFLTTPKKPKSRGRGSVELVPH